MAGIPPITVVASDAFQEAVALIVRKAGQYDLLVAKLDALLKRHNCVRSGTALYYIDMQPDSPAYMCRLPEDRTFHDTDLDALLAGLDWILKDKP